MLRQRLQPAATISQRASCVVIGAACIVSAAADATPRSRTPSVTRARVRVAVVEGSQGGTPRMTQGCVFRTCRHARSAPIRRGICCAAPAGSPASQKRRRASCSSSRSPGRPARMPFTADSHSPAISANPAARSSAWNTESRGNRRRRHLQHPRRPRTLFSRPRRGDACMLSSCARVAHCMASPGVNGRARAASSARNQPTASLTGSGTVHAAAAPFECGGRLNSAPTHRLDSVQHAAQGGRSAPTTCVGTLPWPKRCRPK